MREAIEKAVFDGMLCPSLENKTNPAKPNLFFSDFKTFRNVHNPLFLKLWFKKTSMQPLHCSS